MISDIQNRYAKGMVIALVVIGLSAFNFINTDGHENVSAIQIITLLVCGVGIGILLINFVGWLRDKRPK